MPIGIVMAVAYYFWGFKGVMVAGFAILAVLGIVRDAIGR